MAMSSSLKSFFQTWPLQQCQEENLATAQLECLLRPQSPQVGTSLIGHSPTFFAPRAVNPCSIYKADKWPTAARDSKTMPETRSHTDPVSLHTGTAMTKINTGRGGKPENCLPILSNTGEEKNFAQLPAHESINCSTGEEVTLANDADHGHVCCVCFTTTTGLWRKRDNNDILCNACGLYERLNRRPRPPHLHAQQYRKRQRRQKSGGRGKTANGSHKVESIWESTAAAAAATVAAIAQNKMNENGNANHAQNVTTSSRASSMTVSSSGETSPLVANVDPNAAFVSLPGTLLELEQYMLQQKSLGSRPKSAAWSPLPGSACNQMAPSKSPPKAQPAGSSFVESALWPIIH